MSPGASDVRWLPTTTSATGTTLSVPSARHTCSDASRTEHNDVIDPAGNARQTFPPTVAVCQILYEATSESAHHRNSYIGIDVLRPFQGKGYGSEAIEWVLGYGFQFAGLHRIGIEAFSYNPGALRLYERLGFVPEGRRREEMWFNGAWHDIITFGMLEHEWRESQANGGRKWGQ